MLPSNNKTLHIICTAKPYHVRIIPVAWTSVGNYLVLIVSIVINDSLNRLPGILNVIKVSPQVACVDDGCVVWL